MQTVKDEHGGEYVAVLDISKIVGGPGVALCAYRCDLYSEGHGYLGTCVKMICRTDDNQPLIWVLKSKLEGV